MRAQRARYANRTTVGIQTQQQQVDEEQGTPSLTVHYTLQHQHYASLHTIKETFTLLTA